MKKVERMQSEASGRSPLIVRTADPPNLETPLELLDSYITPNDAFFIRYHLPPPSTPWWVRSIPLERAMDPTTLLAFEMNGERLPSIHGAPLRMVVPGWAGAHWMKWLHKITLQENEAEGRYMQSEYRLPGGTGLQAFESAGSRERANDIALTENVVNSIITNPLKGARLKRGVQLLSGIALGGTAA